MPSKLALISSVAAVSAVSYLVYFDYQRRNSPEFRKKLRKSAKKHARAQEIAAENDKNELKTKLRTQLSESMVASPMPESLKDKEKFFVEEVSRADELHNKPGEQNQIEAAIAFYRALSVYPSPTDLLKIYDQSIKQPVLDMLRMLIVMEPPPSLVAALGAAATAGAAGAGAEGAAGGEDVE